MSMQFTQNPWLQLCTLAAYFNIVVYITCTYCDKTKNRYQGAIYGFLKIWIQI